MATGGVSPENSQIVLGSEEGYDLECQPYCLDGKSAEAVGMCITCQEYLCQPCFDVHKLPTPMRGHKLVKNDQLMKSQISLASKDKCTELCKHHKGKVIEYHCVNHDIFGCTACITLDHRMCEDVVFIPKVAQDLDNNTFYQEVEADLLEMEQKSQNIDTLSTQRTTTLDTDSSDAIEKIQNFRKEIIQKLDKIEAELKQNITSIKAEEMDKLLKLTDQCKQAQKDLEQIIRKVQSLKSGKHHCDLYMYMANIRRKLQPLSNEIADVEHKLTTNDHHIKFNSNLETLETLKTPEAFGIVSLETNAAIKASKSLSTENVRPNISGQSEIVPIKQNKADENPSRTVSRSIIQKVNKTDENEKPSRTVSRPIEKLSHVKDINVRTKKDKETCYITGLVVMPDQRLAIADYNNKRIKTVDVQTGQVTSQLSLSSLPRDIALIESPQVAVTIPEKDKIAFVNLTATPTVDRYLKVSGWCYGVDYREGKLAVAYSGCYKVEVLNLQGTILYTIKTSSANELPYIAFSPDNQSVYISVMNTNSVKCCSLQGKLLPTYADDQLQGPRKVITDSSGHVYVCDSITHTVHQMSSNLRKIKILLNKDDGLHRPMSICYNEQKGEFYVNKDDKVKVFNAVNK